MYASGARCTPTQKSNTVVPDVPLGAIGKFSCRSEEPSIAGNGSIYRQPNGAPLHLCLEDPGIHGTAGSAVVAGRTKRLKVGPVNCLSQTRTCERAPDAVAESEGW
jgi:hypothetical protein